MSHCLSRYIVAWFDSFHAELFRKRYCWGPRSLEVGGRETIPDTSCHHQKDSCIKTGSDESHLNVSLIVRDKATRQCPQTTFFFEERGEARRNRTEVPLLTSLTPYR